MEEWNQTDKLEERLVIKANEKKIPLSGTLELSPVCNMSCEMCYARLPVSRVEAEGGCLNTGQWLEIADELQKSGCIFLLLTGGEPLLYKDFRQLYAGLQERGFIITVNTNGTLIDEVWVDFFAKHPPRRLNITLYAVDEEGYDALCHYREGCQRTIQGIRLLREAGISVKMNVSLTRKNDRDFEGFYKIAEELGVPVEIDSYMFPFCRDREQFDESIRLSPEMCADYYLRALRYQVPGAEQNFLRDAGLIWQGGRFPNHDGIICRAGKSSFWIDWKGGLSPCFALQGEPLNVREIGFADAWKQLSERTASICLSSQCSNCEWQRVCLSCAGRAFSETGAPDGTPDYLCRFIEAIKKGFHVK